jgi:son of sevenless-like protein
MKALLAFPILGSQSFSKKFVIIQHLQHERINIHNPLLQIGQGHTNPTSANPRWFAPELILQHKSRSMQSDVWSFGMLCLELMTGEHPFSDLPRDVNVTMQLARGKLPSRPGPLATARGLSDELWALMHQCWSKRPESRPSMTIIKSKLEHMKQRWPDIGGLRVSRPDSDPTTVTQLFANSPKEIGTETNSTKHSFFLRHLSTSDVAGSKSPVSRWPNVPGFLRPSSQSGKSEEKPGEQGNVLSQRPSSEEVSIPQPSLLVGLEDHWKGSQRTSSLHVRINGLREVFNR